LTANGYKDASVDPEQIDAWWQRWPDANIGLACDMSGVVALDGDPSHYDEHSEALVAQLRGEYKTASQSTPSGGVHYIFMTPADVRLSNSPGNLPPGIDVRSHGYILLYPSCVEYHGEEARSKGVEDGHFGRYRWLEWPHELVPQPLPEFVLELLKPKQEARKAETPLLSTNGNHGQNERYAASALERELEILNNTPEGNRNNQLNISAMKLAQLVAGGELSEAEVIDKLEIVASGIGLNDNAIKKTIQSGFKKGKTEPRSAPETPRLIFRKRDSDEIKEPDLDDLLFRTERTDLGNALVAQELHGKHLAFTSEMGWLYRSNTHWERDEACAQPTLDAIDALQRRADVIIRKMAGQEGVAKALQPVIPSAKHVRDLLYMLRPMITMDQKEFDAEPYLLNCKNGVVDLRCGDLVSHTSSDRFTYCVNAEYSPDAWIDGMYPALVSQWFNGNVDHIEYMQRALGYSITGESREECMFYLVGERGRNGKGTMINGVADILGVPMTQTVTMKAFTNKTADPQGFLIAPLHNARMAIASEKSKGLTLDEELLKTVTGRDAVQVAFKGRTPFNFTPKFKLWLMANNPPKGDPSDDAFWSRVRVISMPNSYQGKEDNTLKDRLRSETERQATLSWLVLGAIQWYRQGLGRAEWIHTETQRIRTEQDTILQFADACLEAADENALFASVYTSYKNWCEAEGIQARANNHLARELHLRGYATDKRSVRVQGEVNPKKVFYLLNTRVTT
jgi:putative DNA primase/helicase